MNKLVIVLMVIGASLLSFGATHDDFVSVTNDWYHGNYSNVYALAEQRLAANTNDLVGAYIMYEWNMILGTKESFSNAIQKVVTMSDMVTNAVFVAEYATTRDNLVYMRDDVIPSVSEARVEADWCKARYHGKRFSEWRLIKILWDEHLW